MQIKHNQPTFGSIMLETDYIKRLSPDAAAKFISSTRKFGELARTTLNSSVEIIPQKGDTLTLKVRPEGLDTLTPLQKMRFYAKELYKSFIGKRSMATKTIDMSSADGKNTYFSFNLLKNEVKRATKNNTLFIA